MTSMWSHLRHSERRIPDGASISTVITPYFFIVNSILKYRGAFRNRAWANEVPVHAGWVLKSGPYAVPGSLRPLQRHKSHSYRALFKNDKGTRWGRDRSHTSVCRWSSKGWSCDVMTRHWSGTHIPRFANAENETLIRTSQRRSI